MTYPNLGKLSRLAVSWAVLSGALAAAAAHAGDDAKDWPCVQGLVHEVSPAVLWTGPPIQEHLESWDRDAGVSRTVAALVSRRATVEDRQAALDDWLQSVPEEEREAQLTAVFAGVWSRLNSRRREFIDGILRYARHQKAVAENIQAHLNEMTELEGRSDEKSIRRLVEIEETVEWQQRIFDQREANIPALCEQPVQVEEELGEIARMIADRLER